MGESKIEGIVKTFAEPIVESFGIELVDVEYIKEGPNWYLRVFIDKKGGVTLDDCELVNGPLGEKLDEVDPIPQSYIFEVSSPGVERPFKTMKDYEKALGEKIQIRFYKPVDGEKSIEGILEAYDAETVTVLNEQNDRKIYRMELISKINRVILF